MKKRICITLLISTITIGLLSGCATSKAPKENPHDTSAQVSVSTTVARHDMSSLVSYADIIVAGTVSDVEAFHLSGNGLYNTSQVEISVSDVYKGSLLTGAKVVVEINSYVGVAGVCVEDEPTMPTFSTNDIVLLFLKENDHGTFYIVGINQGAYFKSDDTKTAQDYRRQNTLGYGPEVVSLDELNKYLAE